MKYLIDTDVLIDYLRGLPKAEKFLEKIIISKHACYISVMTIAELHSGIREGRERETLQKFLQSFTALDIDYDIAKQGGLFRRDFGRSHGVGLGDAIIAATAESCGARLITLNKKHFPMLNNILVPYIKS